jgi:hypothetical protein
MINVTAHSVIYLFRLTDTDVKNVISYASVWLLWSLFQLQLCPKCLKSSIIANYILEGMLFTHVLLMLIILFFLKWYDIVGQIH